MSVTATSASVTVTFTVFVMPSAAVIVSAAVPTFFAVIKPFVSTDAISSWSEEYVRVLSVALSGLTVALSR